MTRNWAVQLNEMKNQNPSGEREEQSKVIIPKNIERDLKNDIEAIENHSVFDDFDSFEDMQVFLEHHAYAVWDFKVLVEAFRSPEEAPNPFPGSSVVLDTADDRDWIDEIGYFETSRGFLRPYHDLYAESMEMLGANSDGLHTVIDSYRESGDIETALSARGVPAEAKSHVLTTWDIVQTGEVHRIASALAFGRRDIIPDRFVLDLKRLYPGTADSYEPHNNFARPMELDWDQHGERILWDNRIKSAENWRTGMKESARRMLDVRLELLDGIHEQIS